MKLILKIKRNKSFWIKKQNAIRPGTKMNFRGNKNKQQGTK
jgi:cytochrome c2